MPGSSGGDISDITQSSPAGIRPDALVDVGITAYRRATYIGQAIESVLAQTMDRWRITVSDNGLGESEIEQAIKSYLADDRISYAPTGHDLTLAQNWTRALTSGQAPYVAVLNDDDRWHPDYLQRRVDVLEAHPECGFAFSAWIEVDEKGAELDRAPLRFPEGVMSRSELAGWFIRENVVVPPAIVMRRAACETVGAYFDDTWQYCDWELCARLGGRFPAYYLACHDNDFRRHATTYTLGTREPPEQLLDMLDHFERYYERYVEGFRLGRLERARVRSRVLLRAAADVHVGGGWHASGPTYRRAVWEYPPTVLYRVSLRMLAKTVLGKRGSRLVARARRAVRPGRGRHSAHA